MSCSTPLQGTEMLKVCSSVICSTAPARVLTGVLIGCESLQVPVFEMGVDAKPAEIARQGLAKARAEDYDAVIVDTAGRLQVCASFPLRSHFITQLAKIPKNRLHILMYILSSNMQGCSQWCAPEGIY